MSARLIALVPAAGLSRRMGTPKLLLTLDRVTVLEHLARGLQHPAISAVGVLIRKDDANLQRCVSNLSATLRVRPIVAESAPGEMRESVQSLLDAFASAHQGGWLLIPADSPWIEPAVLERLITAWQQQPDRIVVPVHQGRRGHPTIFPATLPSDITQIPQQLGLNQLLRAQPDKVLEVDCPERSVLFDLDTPEDFEQLCREWQGSKPA